MIEKKYAGQHRLRTDLQCLLNPFFHVVLNSWVLNKYHVWLYPLQFEFDGFCSTVTMKKLNLSKNGVAVMQFYIFLVKRTPWATSCCSINCHDKTGGVPNFLKLSLSESVRFHFSESQTFARVREYTSRLCVRRHRGLRVVCPES